MQNTLKIFGNKQFELYCIIGDSFIVLLTQLHSLWKGTHLSEGESTNRNEYGIFFPFLCYCSNKYINKKKHKQRRSNMLEVVIAILIFIKNWGEGEYKTLEFHHGDFQGYYHLAYMFNLTRSFLLEHPPPLPRGTTYK